MPKDTKFKLSVIGLVIQGVIAVAALITALKP